MGDGKLATEHLHAMLDMAPLGDLGEIGVERGTTFKKLIEYAMEKGVRAFAFDSFVGMAEPGEFDNPRYGKGIFDVGGPEGFRRLMAGYPEEVYSLHGGYVPDCFDYIPEDKLFAFIYIDLDHYEPTVTAIEWAVAHLEEGGIIAFDDFFEDRRFGEGSNRAMHAFLNEGDFKIVHRTGNDQIATKKVSAS